jgi:phosphatidylglycerophosphate synthase
MPTSFIGCWSVGTGHPTESSRSSSSAFKPALQMCLLLTLLLQLLLLATTPSCSLLLRT